jgi:hypothetical protein
MRQRSHDSAHDTTIGRRAAVVVIGLALALSVMTAAGADGSVDSGPLTGITPTPQQVRDLGGRLVLPEQVDVVAGASADRGALDVTVEIFERRGIGAHIVADEHDARSSVVVYVGGPRETPASASALEALGVEGPNGLADEGYVLAAGRDDRGRGLVVLSGVDATGTFYAAQSLRQLVEDGPGGSTIPAVAVRDWPGYRIRGGMESFYGTVWTQADRRSQIEFLARNKMNEFFYGPADDPRTGTTWSALYDAEELARLEELVALARSRHVDFVYRISPEAPLAPNNGMCHASRSDRDKLLARFDQLWDIGVRSFVIAWDDVSGRFACAEDSERYGDDAAPLAAAQADVTNAVQAELIERRPGASRLRTVPTEYWGTDESTYRSRFDELLSPEVDIYWTGPQVVSRSITNADFDRARAAFPRHRLMIWDNYPVNDYAANRLLLGPNDNREAGMENAAIGISFNEMVQQAPSQIALGTQADFAWNPGAYDPERSWTRTLRALGGDAYEELRLFAENNRASLIDGTEPVEMTRLIRTLLADYRAGRNVIRTARELTAELDRLSRLPEELRARLDDPLMVGAIRPWLDRLGHYGAAGKAAVRLLEAQARGDGEGGWIARRDQATARAAVDRIPQQVSPGPIESLLDFAATQSDSFIGDRWYGDMGSPAGLPEAGQGSSLALATDRRADTAYVAARAPRAGEALSVPITKPHRLESVTVVQDASSPARGVVEIQTADGSWTALGALGKGYTSLDAGQEEVSAIRIAWAEGSPAPRIYEISPHYADVVSARISADRRGLVAAGTTTRLTATIEAHDKDVFAATLRVTAPDGWQVEPAVRALRLRADGRTLTTEVPVEIGIPADAPHREHRLELILTRENGAELAVPVTLTVGTRPEGAYRDVVLGSNPSGYWRLGESSGSVAFNAITGGSDGTYLGGAQPGAPGVLADDTAGDLPRGYVEVPRTPTTNLTGPFTLEAWVNLDAIAPSPGQGIIESYTGPAVNGFALRVDNGRLQGWSLGTSGFGVVTGQTALTPGRWHHVAVVFDGTRLTVYLDGLADGSVATTVAPGSGVASIKLGARGDDAAQQLNGDLDEVAIYPAALSAEDIAAHYLAAR